MNSLCPYPTICPKCGGDEIEVRGDVGVTLKVSSEYETDEIDILWETLEESDVWCRSCQSSIKNNTVGGETKP